jgi:hypothetical protein
MVSFIQANEGSKERLTAPIAGNRYGGKKFSKIEAIQLKSAGFTHISQLFGRNEFTGKLCKNTNCEFPPEIVRIPGLEEKCKFLRRKVAEKLKTTETPLCPFYQILENSKWSQLFRKLKRNEVEEKIRGPPSYWTRIRDGFPVPALDKYMQGYRNLKKIDISVRNREIGLDIMNRVLWTNLKNFQTRGGSNACALCGGIENTEHVIFSCPSLAEKLWESLGDSVKSILGLTNSQSAIHAFEVMFNCKKNGIEDQQATIILTLIQHGKNVLNTKRYKRCTEPALVRNRYNDTRIAALWINIIERNITYFKYKGKENTVENLRKYKNYFVEKIN